MCKVSLVGQWIEEAKSKLKEPGVVYPYHGSSRKRDPATLSKNAIVVTTYETLKSDAVYHKIQSGSDDYVPPLCQIRWWRVIGDECHSISAGGTEKSDALMDLVADHKWLMSGTRDPVVVSSTCRLLALTIVFLIRNANTVFIDGSEESIEISWN